MVAALYAIGALLTLAWLALTLWALLHDRSRGRARCPKCFFSLQGLAATRCPECGGDVTDERRLHRTHRRWGVAVLAAVLLLLPAALTGGLARVQQAGAWADIPSAVLVRLLWLGDDKLRAEVLSRVGRYEVSRAQAEVIARRAATDLDRNSRRDGAYELLEALARNSYSNSFDDRKPMLEELAPEHITPALLARLDAGDVAERSKVVALFSHLRDVDERANLTLLAFLADAKLRRAAQSALGHQWRPSDTVERLPPPPQVLHGSGPRSGRPSPHEAEERVWLGEQVGVCGLDREAVLRLARGLAKSELQGPAPESGGVLLRATGLWLWCRLGRDEPGCFEALETLAADENRELREVAVQQLTAFEWSGRVEAVLRSALNDPDPYSGVQFQATQAIEDFGSKASGLIPDMLEYAARAKRGASSAFPETFAVAGGNPQDLLDVLTERLALAHEQRAKGLPDADSVDLGFDFRWLADMGIQDPRAAETVRSMIEFPIEDFYRPVNDAYMAFLAHAVLTGDGNYALEALLRRDLDLNGSYSLGSYEDVLCDLCRQGLADEGRIIDRFVHQGSLNDRAGFLNLMKLLPAARLPPYRSALEMLAADKDTAIATAASTQLRRLD